MMKGGCFGEERGIEIKSIGNWLGVDIFKIGN